MRGLLPKAERRLLAALALAGLVAACASGPAPPPYPAFVQVDKLPDAFVAVLPGSRVKQLGADSAAGRTSLLVSVPPDWSFGTGATPDRSIEIYVLAGRLTIGEFALEPGGYAYVPAGNFGLTMRTDTGARMLYFQDRADAASVIQTPMILHRDQVPWSPRSPDPADAGIAVKELRADPGSGARTWLERVEPGVARPWRRSSAAEEGMLLEGRYRDSECVDGKPYTADYLPGGYFYRPAEVAHGGPASRSDVAAVWLLRTPAAGTVTPVPACMPGE